MKHCYIMYKDDIVSELWYDKETQYVRSKHIKPYKAMDNYMYVSETEKVTFEELEDFLKYRCFEEKREDSKLLLSALGLYVYDIFDIVERTHGVLYEDLVWLRFEGENITFADVTVRK